MIDDVTLALNQELLGLTGLQDAFAFLHSCPFFGRETTSAALEEISEHIVARFVGGQRCLNGNKGFDIIGGNGAKIEVKSRLPGEWGDRLQFNFRKHTAGAEQVFCVCWKFENEKFLIGEGYRMTVSELLERWGKQNQKRYFARTNLRQLRATLR